MRLKLLFETVLLFVLSFTWLNAQVNNVTHGTGPFTTIQAAIDDAATVNGDVIEVGNGTYTESITIDKEITLQSVNGAAVTMIEGAGTTVITIDADNVVIDGFTITNPSGKHGIYAQDQSGITIRNNILDDIGSTDATTSGTNYGIAVVSSSANVDGVLIEDNTLTNISGGSGKKSVNGIALGWSTGSFDISNVTIQNNSITSLVASSTTPWGMYGIIVNHASGSSSNTGKTTNLNILNNTIENLAGYWIHGIGLEGLTPSAVVEGNTFANFIAEKAYDNYAVFFESNSYIGTVVINQNNFNTTRGIGIHSDLLSTLTTEVLDATENWWGDASGPSGTDLEGSGSVWGTDDSDASIVSYVDYSPWLGASTGTTPMTWYTDDSIQDAIDAASDDDIINVAAGTYTETLNVDKSLTISGATAAINKNGYTVPANYNWDDNVESIIKHPDPSGGYTTIVNIEDVDNVTFEGFIIQELNADGNLNTSLVRVYAHSKEITNITIRNNIIGPNTNVASQDGTHGRMGLYIVNHPYNNLGVVNSTISGNKIFDCKGNGNNIFLWSSYYVYGAPEPASMSGTVIEDNEIYGAHRSGIETAGGYSDLTIRNNKIYDNSGLPSDDPDYLKYGNGILLVRGSGDKSSGGSAFGPVNLTIENNEIYNNEKNGIYAGPVNENYTITGNDIHDNGWDGIQIDLEGHYYNPDFDPTSGPFSVYDASTNINFNDNDVYDNTLYGTRVYGTPTNGFELNAKNNWWGDPTGPYHATNNTSATGDSVSDNVVYSPWIANSNDTPHDEDNLWTYYVDASNPDAINDVLYDPGFVKGDTVVANGGVFNAITIDKEFVLIGMNGAEILNGSPAITISSNNVTVTGFTFSFGTADYAIKVTGDYSGIVVKNCEFLVTNGIDNDNGGPYYVLAVNNDWGDTSGPTHVVANPGGSGSTITDYVIFESGGLVEPLNNITGISILPTFTWEEFGVAPSVSYKLLISENSDMSSPLYEENLGSDLTITMDETITNFPLSNSSKYYWQIVGLDGEDNEIYETDIYFFTTVAGMSISLANPTDASSLYAYDPVQFTWYLSQAAGSLKYYLQIKASGTEPSAADWFADVQAEVTTPGSIAFFYDNLTNIYQSVTGLSGATRYYWRVVGYYDDGITSDSFDFEDRVVDHSPVFYFDTQGGTVMAYPSWPTGSYTVYTLTPTFYWYTMQYEPSATFEVLYSKSNTTGGSGELTNGVTALSAGTSTFVSVTSDLDSDETYYWQVKTTYNSEVLYSSVVSFKTYAAAGVIPTAVTLSYPTGGVSVYTTSPTMCWYIEGVNTGVVTYTVEVSTTGGAPWTDKGSTTDTYLQISGLTPGEDYTWRVKSSKNGYSDVYSSTAEFSVAGGLSSYPVATYPVDNPTLYTATPTLSWYMEGSTLAWDNYVVAWATTDKDETDWKTQMIAGGSDTYSTADMNEAYYTFPSELDYGTTYYWAVAAYDGSGSSESDYSDVSEGSFTIAGGSVSIIQTYPSDNSVITTKTPTFLWYVTGSTIGITHYKVTYSNTELFIASYTEEIITTSASASVTSALSEGSSYWWYVSVSYDGESGPYTVASSTLKFTVDPGASSVAPVAASPVNGVTISTSSPQLSWFLPAQSSSTLSYDVELADNSEFNNSTILSVDELNANIENLEDGECFWRVRSKTNGKVSDYSTPKNFKVGSTVTGTNDIEVMPEEFVLEQNYPNPFNPETNIKYALPNASGVTLKIYNMLGQEVRTLVNEFMNAGTYELVWNGKDNNNNKVTSGVYIYRIVAGNFVQSKKMILLK